MKITDVESIILRLPVVRAIGDGCQSVLLIRVHTDEGLVGIGEAHTNPLVSKAILDAPLCSVSAEGLRSLLIGEDPRDVGRLWDKMYKHSATYGRRGALMHAISGIDIALWDLLGKVSGLPIHRLLGGPRRDAVPAYASDLSQPDLGDTIALARRHRDAGFKAMKFGWGGLGQDPRADVRAVAAIRAEIGDAMDLMIDIGVPMPLDDALYLGRAFADSGVYFLEEPLSPDDVSGFARLVAQSPTPIATGEKETTQYPYLDLMDRGGLRIIQPDVARVGGISEAVRIVHHAEARGARVIPHCWSTDILVAATAHVLAVQRDAPYLEFNATDNPLRTDLLVEPMRVVDGLVRVPDGPGLGITLNEDTIERYRWNG
ncbi:MULTISPECIES: mandelate racemase/muconate lactonizing enzyme family protein [unclassified Chelatococcus]|uniref:mandelate racemase/muconate lactonizing enzyme family protein n=1 Tax=unclassified Chelatococcus TaxID=2638111 RepID=UPI001BCE8173|nr:mandelate racemase/muconate lactonizing enzyme family protein [Chelatococcus sp.]MBS7697340.1 mandelate racemase/muconate lactonizing enzyme family protein [Chelatococcus sp. YT9]MBX3556363.1 mandelate racemase/muconate lactonizing enzyme family protein [Chelatococcus sp.]